MTQVIAVFIICSGATSCLDTFRLFSLKPFVNLHIQRLVKMNRFMLTDLFKPLRDYCVKITVLAFREYLIEQEKI